MYYFNYLLGGEVTSTKRAFAVLLGIVSWWNGFPLFSTLDTELARAYFVYSRGDAAPLRQLSEQIEQGAAVRHAMAKQEMANPRTWLRLGVYIVIGIVVLVVVAKLLGY